MTKTRFGVEVEFNTEGKTQQDRACTGVLGEDSGTSMSDYLCQTNDNSRIKGRLEARLKGFFDVKRKIELILWL